MKYLVFGCDPVGDRLVWEEDELHPQIMPVNLPAELVADMLSWNEQMAGAVQVAADAASVVKRLNAEGESLAHRIAGAVTGGVKVRYLSE